MSHDIRCIGFDDILGIKFRVSKVFGWQNWSLNSGTNIGWLLDNGVGCWAAKRYLLIYIEGYDVME